jgi:hypothetical protein
MLLSSTVEYYVRALVDLRTFLILDRTFEPRSLNAPWAGPRVADGPTIASRS